MIPPVEAPPPPAYILALDIHDQQRSGMLAWTESRGFQRTWKREGGRCWYLDVDGGYYTSPRPFPVRL